ncbi:MULTISPECIES: sugar ABC transporter permease [unclassified Streptomyces]|jgi:multiple sugar transport system permease protein|uniref:carbohydrate ABC transporter permease n=1 Tax=unclassified Streptomyces TaxID=2593676 RepID=UPI000F4D8C14|nr:MULTISPECIES: sugar ABC transporter permease [unclassified Streptomyces]MDH6447831.1 multiple sugar transport system permease protein [Streptomyces sp. SAI-119]MDH6501446.1 multiple sugar transport system permease protein [Streptomyces sp. SAI-149]QUC60119.1 sugar ABC transporter permease [Streptomyces sp. A2-16]
MRQPSARRRRAGCLFCLPGMAFLALFLAYPLLYNVWTSVHDVDLGQLLGGAERFTGLDNYRTVADDPAFWHSVRLSLVFTLSSLLLQFTIGFALALLFARPFPFNGLLRSLLLTAWLLPPVVSGTLFRWMLDAESGAYNALLEPVGLSHDWLTDPSTSLAGVVFANVWIGVPFNMLLLLVGLHTIDPQLHEAAAIDGASAWQRFRHITLPLMRPVSVTVLLLGLLYTFKVFDLVFVMTGGGPVDATRVLSLYVYEVFFTSFRFGEGAAAALLLLVVPLLAGVLYVRRLRREDEAPTGGAV